MKNLLTFKSILLCMFILSSCAYHKKIIQEPVEIQDLVTYPQDIFYYSKQIKNSDLPLMEFEQQLLMDSLSGEKFFAVWTDTLQTDSLKVQELHRYYINLFNRYKSRPGYAENKLKRDSLFAIEMIKTTELSSGFNSFKKAIVLEYVDIRVVPSNKPYFLNFSLAGEGFPFDYWQNSTIPVGTPVFIYHETEHWVLIGSHICHGWIPKNKIAYINEEQIQKILNLPQIALTKDNQALLTSNNIYKGRADIGTVLPLINEEQDYFKVLFFERDSLAYAKEINLKIKKDIAAIKPIPLTIENIATLSNEMMGQLYGWGGMFFNRDCSQVLLDLFMPFGILLPRNSRQQANLGGIPISIKELSSTDKKKFIIENAKPFTTMIGMPGHIMLYIGHVDDEPLVFHNMWGVRTMHRKTEGRHIVGKAVITSLEPGKELKLVDKKRTLINRIEKITFLF